MQITISAPTVLNEFEFAPTNFDIFQSTCSVDGVDYVFSRNVNQYQWEHTQIKVDNKIIGPGEDPRAFDLCGMPACYSVLFNSQSGFVPQLYIKMDNWIRLEIQMAENINPGKNWSPFVYNNEVYFVHEVSPFRVMKLVGDTASTVFTQEIKTDTMPIDRYPVLRGGCNGLELDNGLVLGFGHDNYAAGHINTIKHRPFGWSIDMNKQKVSLVDTDFEWDSRYNIVDPTAFIKRNDSYYLMTVETELVWGNPLQAGRTCLYPITIS
jgi:hypothetical protein